ncbi:MAG: discoidin domain-containing protein [Planctomycetota bacterium]
MFRRVPRSWMLIIEGELNPNPPTFDESAPSEIANRQPRTTAQVIYEPEHWATVGEKKRTPDLSPVITEIINQPGWVAGNALVLIIRDNPANPSKGNRTADAYGGGEGNMAFLHIEYTLGNAGGPSPADGAIDVPRDVVLSWTPGVNTAPVNGHKVYFSENFNDVNDGIGGITQSDSSYDPGRLDFSTTYYWRVDEDSGPPDNMLYEGNVWSFTTELFAYPIENITATASTASQADMGPENTINGSGLDADDLHSTEATAMWMSSAEPQGAWIEYEFDQVYKLHELWVWNANQTIETFVGFGFKDVTVEYSANGIDYTTLGTTHQFAQAPGADGYAHNTTIDLGGTAARYVRLTANSAWGAVMPQFGLSEVRFFYIPVNATKPSPDSGATGVDVDVILGWRAGREAATHDVYLSTDEQAVIDGTAPVATVTEASHGPLALDLGVAHYWKVNEVNEAETPSTWESAIWSFTTTDNIVVDDFESYNDLDPEDPASKRIFNVWIDGFGVATNGSLVGYENPPFCEQTIVHGGKQSMPLAYSNTGGAASSEAELTLSPAQDWTVSGVKTLTVYFHGTVGNTGQLYVKINGSKVTYDGDAANLARTWWHLWNIDLASVGTNLQNVTSLSIGIDGNGAAGTLYFDDIGLYRVAPTPPAPVNEWRIATSSDDAEEHIPAGGVDLGSSDLELGHEGTMSATSLQVIGCRWVALPIPKGATITEAWVQFSADSVGSARHIPDVSLIIEGQLSTDPATFSSTSGDISGRPKTTAQVVWDIPQWMTEHGKGPEERTSDISSIIQEVVNQDGWNGNAIVLIFRDNPAKPSQGTREAESFNGSPNEAPLLYISYQ